MIQIHAQVVIVYTGLLA